MRAGRTCAATTIADMAELIQVSTAAPDRESALALVKSAVEAGLAASGQVVGPVASVFVHLGEFGVGEEWQVTLMTSARRFTDLQEHLIGRHPWDKPQVTAVEIVASSPDYTDWVKRTTT